MLVRVLVPCRMGSDSAQAGLEVAHYECSLQKPRVPEFTLLAHQFSDLQTVGSLSAPSTPCGQVAVYYIKYASPQTVIVGEGVRRDARLMSACIKVVTASI